MSLNRKRNVVSESSPGSSGKRRKQGENRKKLVDGNVYYTEVNMLPDAFNVNAFTLKELLGEIQPESSLHFNFMIDLQWLLRQYPETLKNNQINLIVGEKMGTDFKYMQKTVSQLKATNITVEAASLPIPFGTHHTKLSLFESCSRVHLIISTANLVPGDWQSKTQCFYYASGDLSEERIRDLSPFHSDLMQYLSYYKSESAKIWLEKLTRTDFGHITDRIISSVPGYHKAPSMQNLGHLALRKCLSGRPHISSSSRRLFVAQCSSIGSLGANIDNWVKPQFCKSLNGGKEITPNDRFFVIYPCVEDVRGSIEGYEAGVSLPYQKETADKQVWLKNIMCKWRCEKNGRSRAMPHSKTYAEIVDGNVQWMLMTSANLSKAAWGALQKNCAQLMIRSYELGILICDPERLSVPFDYPILKYSTNDEPWICNKNYELPDSLGEKWIVSI